MKMNRTMALGATVAMLSIGAAQAQTPAPHDGLEANLWTQRSVEFKGNALTVYALGRLRLDQALVDKKWTAAPVEQTGNFANLPPAGAEAPILIGPVSPLGDMVAVMNGIALAAKMQNRPPVAMV